MIVLPGNQTRSADGIEGARLWERDQNPVLILTDGVMGTIMDSSSSSNEDTEEIAELRDAFNYRVMRVTQ